MRLMFISENQIIDIRAIGLLGKIQMSHVSVHLLFILSLYHYIILCQKSK